MSPPHNDFTEVHSLANTKANDLEKANPTETQNWSSFSLKELTETATTLLKFGLPTSMGYICEYASGLVCLRYAGKYGTPSELAGAALGFTWNRMFGVGIISSINQGFSVHAAQLYGAKKYRELGLLLQKNLFVLSIVLIPLLLSFYFADSILIGCGINPEVSINAGIFLRNSMLSVVGLAVFECLRFYLIAQNFFYVQSVVQGSLSVVHIFWCNLFVVGFGMPVSGVAIAKSITDLSCAAAIWVYIKFKKDFAESWIQWESACLEGWFTYLKKMLVIGANIYVEWVSYEISLIIISMLNDESILGAHGIALTLISSFYMLPMGNSYTMQAYIGNAVGEGSVKKAQKFMLAGLGLNAIMTGLNVIIMLGWNDYIASCFTNDEETKTVLQTIILMYGFAHMVDTNLGHVTGILKILGGEKEILVYFCLFYAVIGVNCEWIFGVLFGFGYKAIWGSFILGMCLMCGWAVIRLARIDWKQEVAKVQQRIGEHKNDEDKYYVEMNEM